MCVAIEGVLYKKVCSNKYSKACCSRMQVAASECVVD
jgi:hypothetical protein